MNKIEEALRTKAGIFKHTAEERIIKAHKQNMKWKGSKGVLLHPDEVDAIYEVLQALRSGELVVVRGDRLMPLLESIHDMAVLAFGDAARPISSMVNHLTGADNDS